MSSHATDLAVHENLLRASEKFQTALALYPFLFPSPLPFPSLFPSLLPIPFTIFLLPLFFLPLPLFFPFPGGPTHTPITSRRSGGAL